LIATIARAKRYLLLHQVDLAVDFDYAPLLSSDALFVVVVVVVVVVLFLFLFSVLQSSDCTNDTNAQKLRNATARYFLNKCCLNKIQ
jgi:uncharacterized protein HemY